MVVYFVAAILGGGSKWSSTPTAAGTSPIDTVSRRALLQQQHQVQLQNGAGGLAERVNDRGDDSETPGGRWGLRGKKGKRGGREKGE